MEQFGGALADPTFRKFLRTFPAFARSSYRRSGAGATSSPAATTLAAPRFPPRARADISPENLVHAITQFYGDEEDDFGEEAEGDLSGPPAEVEASLNDHGEQE